MKKSMKYSVYRDGSAWCAVADSFVNLQESLAGFGDTPVKALEALLVEEADAESKRCQGLRHWICNNCKTVFVRGKIPPGWAPACPRCKCGDQYVYEHAEGTNV